jgi:hypothetical protein
MAVLKRSLAALALMALLLALPWAARAQASASEYAVKAAFLYNFTKFVEWPADAFTGEHSQFKVCVLGEDPFGKSLGVIAGESVAGRRISLLRTGEIKAPEGCHILFISRSERDRLSQVLADLKQEPVLTVGDTGGFLDQGGIINFILEGGKVRFEINQEAAERAGIKISSKLLRLAIRVKGNPGAQPGP